MIVKLEIPTGNPIHIQFEKDLQLKNYKYLDRNSKLNKSITFLNFNSFITLTSLPLC